MGNLKEIREAAEKIKNHLEEEWISEGCNEGAAFGCPSCQARRLCQDLDALVSWLDED